MHKERTSKTMYKEKTWWKTFDYKTGHTYILGEKFAEKGQAMQFAKSCGMIILPQSTVSMTDIEYRNAILENENKMLKEQLKKKVN
jgi:hypothetical protein